MAERLIRKIALQVFGRRVFDDGVLDVIDLFVEIFDRLERLVDRQLEEPDQEMVGPCRSRSRGSRSMLSRSWSRIGKGAV